MCLFRLFHARKAFDSVSHSKLLSKLWHYMMVLLEIYETGSLHNAISAYLLMANDLPACVPQGSILRPLLFWSTLTVYLMWWNVQLFSILVMTSNVTYLSIPIWTPTRLEFTTWVHAWIKEKFNALSFKLNITMFTISDAVYNPNYQWCLNIKILV